MFEASGKALTKEESIEMFQAMTRGLNSSDMGSLGESWFQRYTKKFEDVDLDGHPSFVDANGKKRQPDFIKRGGKLEGGTAVEVKATRVGLNPGRDVPQIEQTCELAARAGDVLVNGKKVAVKKVRLVFLYESGAKGSTDALDDLFEQFGDVLEVEVFFATGPKTFQSFGELNKALS